MKVAVLTLGCKVNQYESDSLVFELEQRGIEATNKLEFADVYVVNTCAVTNEAEAKSRQMIERAKKLNPAAKFFVVGCASQHNKTQFENKGAVYVLGTSGKKKILDKIENLQIQNLEKNDADFSIPTNYEDDLFSAQLEERAYIKVQDGCNRFCTYCLIPYLRGRSRSRSLESIISEVKKLPENVKEIVLVGIDLADFQIDGKKALGLLLQQLDGFGKRLRLSSLENGLIDEEFLTTLSNLKNFCPHFHLSLQSGSDDVLKKMNRRYSTRQFEEKVQLIRKFFPNAGITTDIIVGFPTETEENFEETLRFVEKVRFSQIHVFPYSKRDGTVASKMFVDLPKSVKSARVKKLQALGEKLKEQFIAQNKFGKVLIETCDENGAIGYTENYIKTHVSGHFHSGQIVSVQIIGQKNGTAQAIEVDSSH